MICSKCKRDCFDSSLTERTTFTKDMGRETILVCRKCIKVEDKPRHPNR